jgi:hypothetical protein
MHFLSGRGGAGRRRAVPPPRGGRVGVVVVVAAEAALHHPAVEAAVASARGAAERAAGALLARGQELAAPVHGLAAHPRRVVPPALPVPHAAAPAELRRRRRVAPSRHHQPLHSQLTTS